MKPLSIFTIITAVVLLPGIHAAKDLFPKLDSKQRPDKAPVTPPFSNIWDSESWEPSSEENFWRKQTANSKKPEKQVTNQSSKQKSK